MPPPKDPIKYALYIQRQSESHKGQTSWSKGKTGIYKPESIQLMRDSHKGQVSGFKGKSHTPESIAQYKEKRKSWVVRPKGSKLSETHIKNNSLAHIGLPSGFKGKKQSEESNKKNREKHLGKPSPRKGAVLSESTKELVRQARAKQIFPLKDTKPERILQIALSLNNVKYQKHKLFQSARTFFHQVDIFIEPNLIIEVDGDYWHSLPKVIDRDNFNNRKLSELGNRVIRVKEHLIKKNVQEFVESLISGYPFRLFMQCQNNHLMS
jgi:very-short-patch-repair endonuclease